MPALSDAALVLVVVCTATYLSTSHHDQFAESAAASTRWLHQASLTGETIDLADGLGKMSWNKPNMLNAQLPAICSSPPTFIVLGLMAAAFWLYCLVQVWIEMSPVLVALSKRSSTTQRRS